MDNLAKPGTKQLAFFEHFLTALGFLRMIAGVAVGKFAPQITAALGKLELVQGSNVNAPIAVLIWLMISPMSIRLRSRSWPKRVLIFPRTAASH